MIEIKIQFDETNGSWNWQTPANPVMTIGLLELFKKLYIEKNVQNKVEQPLPAELSHFIRR